MMMFVLADTLPSCLLVRNDLGQGAFRDEEAAWVVKCVFEGFLQRHLEGVAGADERAGEEDLKWWSEGKCLFVRKHDLTVFLRAFRTHCGGEMEGCGDRNGRGRRRTMCSNS